ncbi:type I 3-dehydroquinate dehydratase [Peptacetobacter sp.]|uniref:type I 3-dehydroquinate dehydratase n=1 Tax=Peptacetobacter sp. TaxID=2991975 RepID=UPI00261C9854|nr:type I 3-dehydroquinate dehydratase [Peptacetobacter sp.]
MNICKIRNLTIGDGNVKICAPIVCSTREEILLSAKKIKTKKIDIVEFRADYYKDIFNLEEMINTLKELKTILSDIPVIFTLRTEKEGGKVSVSLDEYIKINENIIKSNLIDVVDIELFTIDDYRKDIVDLAHRNKIKVIGSSHDFKSTPEKDEMINRLKKMQSLNMDILKIAVMPNNREDILKLLSATEEMRSKFANRPIITISMGKYGIITRISGEIFGSALTFASVDNKSAPGQIYVDDLKNILDIIHRNIH